MADYILVNQDRVNFLPAFPPANIIVKPGQLSASTKNVRINGKLVCLAKDCANVQVNACQYIAPPFVIPGNGCESVQQLAANQSSRKVRVNGQAVLLKGGQFSAKFNVRSQAKTPPAPPVSPIPDPVASYSGFGVFQNANCSVRAS